MTRIEIVRMLTGDNSISDDFIAFYLDSTVKFILSYCNIEEIPEGLEPTLCEIAAYRVKANSSNGQASLGQGMGRVGSVSDGNQSVSYVVGSSGSKDFISEEDIIAAYGNILDRYRRLVTSRPHKCCRTLGSRRICQEVPYVGRGKRSC